MNLDLSLSQTIHFLSFALFLQAYEMKSLVNHSALLQVWSYKNIREEFGETFKLPSSLLRLFFSESSFKILIYFQLAFSGLSFFFPIAILFSILLVLHLFICLRFRGTFNGGSDNMTFILLTGTVISLLNFGESGKQIGLIYIAVHGIYSYFKAGLAKIKYADWRSGNSLPQFLSLSFYKDSQQLAFFLKERPLFSKFLAWGTLIFEISIVLILIFPKLAVAYCAAAVMFHFFVYFFLGLNRFFWVWIATWPAILYLTQII